MRRKKNVYLAREKLISNANEKSNNSQRLMMIFIRERERERGNLAFCLFY